MPLHGLQMPVTYTGEIGLFLQLYGSTLENPCHVYTRYGGTNLLEEGIKWPFSHFYKELNT